MKRDLAVERFDKHLTGYFTTEYFITEHFITEVFFMSPKVFGERMNGL